MKKVFALILSIIIILTLVACGPVDDNISQNEPSVLSSAPQIESTPDIEGTLPVITVENDLEIGKGEMIPIIITVDNTTFNAKLYDNEASNTLINQMPMTLNISELNGNEKFYDLPYALPSDNTERPDRMQAGEIMCWSSNTLVLFYESFPNSYGGYVRLGYIENTEGLADALGTGSVEVTFSL